jgi:hypothetical protein
VFTSGSGRPRRTRRIISSIAAIGLAAAGLTAAGLGAAAPAFATTQTTAWSAGAFNLDRPNIVRRSDIVLGSPNNDPTQSLPVGNGSVGAAVWDAAGFTAQLNRDDTFPDRKSPGQVTIPGLSAITSAANFTASLDLYTGILTESGGGMTASIYVRADKDEMIVDVTGANPSVTQTATASLWTGRSPTAATSGSTGTLAETWADSGTGHTGSTFGTLLALTAGGTNVTATVANSKAVTVSFKPNSDGSFHVLIGAPHWAGGNAATTASSLFGSDATATAATLQAPQISWWQTYWSTADMMEINSSDGSGNYMENLRTLYLYNQASDNRGTYPGTQGGVADLFEYEQDAQAWQPDDYWFWDLRNEIDANLTSGESALNANYFSLYTSNVAALTAWTQAHMPGHTGICVPETMRFNGNGQYGTDANNASCDDTISPSYNSLTITSGAEVAYWIWQQYLQTGNTTFLQAGYPIMKGAAQFLLSYATLGADGKLHTTANAHETQWDVTDPITDIAAMQSVFPIVVSAAQKLGMDPSLVTQLTTAEGEIPPLPRTDAATHTQVLTSSSDNSGDVFAYSTQPAAQQENDENPDLEPVFPYGVVGDNSGILTTIANRTWVNREHVDRGTYAYDGIQAARLDQPTEVESSLVANAEMAQVYPNGFGDVNGQYLTTPYGEQQANDAGTLNEALAQDYDGVLRIAPAWPSDWDVDGQVSVQNNSKVDVQVRNGVPVTVVLEAGTAASMVVKSPWAGQSVIVVDATSGSTVVAATTAPTFTIATTAGHKYLIELSASPFTSLTYAQVTGSPATTDRHLGPIQIGLDAKYSSLAASFNNVGVTSDTNTAAGNFDGGGSSFSKQSLATAGLVSGTAITHSGLSLVWPTAAGTGQPDNTVASGQTIALSGSGSILGFLLSADYGSASGTGTITFTDGTTEPFTLTSPDWWGPPGSKTVVAQPTYINGPGNTQSTNTVYVYYQSVTLTAGETVASVTLPNVSSGVTTGTVALHVFAMSLTKSSLANSFNDVGVTADTNTGAGNFDGGNVSFSKQALATAGLTSGGAVTSNGHHFTWPTATGTGSVDNTAAGGQLIAITGTGTTLGFLVSSSYGPASGAGTITYTDGSTSSYTLTSPDWFNPSGTNVVAAPTYINETGNSQSTQTVGVYYAGVAVTSGKTVASVTLPNVSKAVTSGTAALHVFALSLS